MEERLIHCDVSFPPRDESAVVSQPGECSLDFPPFSISPQRPSILSRRTAASPTMWTDQFYSSLRELPAQRIAIIRPIGDQPLRLLLGSSSSSAWYGDRVQCFLDERDFPGGRRVQVVSQRKTLAVDHHHPLRSLAALGLADAGPPFFAGAKLPSMNTSLQSNWPRSSNSDKNARQTFNQTPRSSQSLSRRQQVEELGYRLGRSPHGAPVRRTQRMPSNTARSSAQGRPPRRERRSFGNTFSIRSHCSSVNFQRCLAIADPPSKTNYNICNAMTIFYLHQFTGRL